MTCSSGPPCQPGNTALSIALACSARRQDAAAARAAQRLVRRERDDVGERHGVRVGATGDEPGEVGDVEHEQRADLVGDRCGTAPGRVDAGSSSCRRRSSSGGARARGRARCRCRSARRSAPTPVRHEVVQHAAGVDRRAVGEVAAVVEAEAEHRVARLRAAPGTRTCWRWRRECGCTLACSAPNSSLARSMASCLDRRRSRRCRRSSACRGSPRSTCW